MPWSTHLSKVLSIFNMTSKRDDKGSSTSPMPIFQGLAAGAMGLVFGVAMEKARVTEPAVIQAQMAMSKFIMLKMFLSAVVSGQLGLVLLQYLSPKHFNAARKAFAGCVEYRGWVDVALGGAILGAGMSLSGACPGMVIVQVGAGAQHAGYTVAGLFLGAYLYSLAHPTLARMFHTMNPSTTPVFLDRQLGLPFAQVALSFAALLAGTIMVVEELVGWTDEVPRVLTPVDSSYMSMHAWSPIVSGALVGALQIPAVLLLGDTLGSSTAYMTLCAQPTRFGFGKDVASHLADFTDGMSNWWQVVYIGTAALAAAWSASQGTPSDVVIERVPPVMGVVGGVLMLFGSRLAGGCTSGHGLSGMGLLASTSFAAVAAMFAGGMATQGVLSLL
eukprot:TRINITY_DN11467_c0_g1_i3.p1 TRINITY_DN11467_c0_g1~~TRINITY_DN11467_c0_g1_i3.p1  ORF type:complete len:388 (+),score=69.75 TRINITY_DN11467_c0_g1_i3:265-1428(+)